MLKIKNQKLSLTKYPLSLGHCKAIASALKVFPEYAHTFELQDNSLSDEMVSVLIEAMSQIKHLRSFQLT
jgi:hypothetical protein